MKHYDTIIIGAGAAGLMCAATAGQRGRKVLVIDHSKSVGDKIRISGGGRCNFTNLHTSSKNFLSRNPHFCVSALKRFTQHDFIALVKKHAIDFHEKTLGQLFCDVSSKQIIAMLLQECEEGGVDIRLNSRVTQIHGPRGKCGVTNVAEVVPNICHSALAAGSTDSSQMHHFELSVENEVITCQSLVLATGGMSIPKMGATDFSYKIARQFGLKIIEPTPALVPFTLDQEILSETKSLAGVSANAIVSCGKVSFREAMLFTHLGLSGPAILQISSYWKKGNEITINFIPDIDFFQKLQAEKKLKPKQEVKTILALFLSKRFANYLAEKANCSGNLADLSNKKLRKIADLVNAWTIIPSGTEGFAKAEVTIGGIDTDEISSKTFEAKSVPGLFVIGEAMDVTGWLGGFNFQWAWASGRAAGQFI